MGAGVSANVFGFGVDLSANLDAFQIRVNPKIPSNGAIPAGIELGWEASAGFGVSIPGLAASDSWNRCFV